MALVWRARARRARQHLCKAAELAKSRKFESPYANTSSPFISRSGGCATLGLDAFRRSSRYQENNSVNQQCHAGHYPKRGECVAYLGSRLPALVPSCYARKVVCSPARYKSHTPHYIAREWADLPFFFCIRVSRSPSRHFCNPNGRSGRCQRCCRCHARSVSKSGFLSHSLCQ